jgi:hypothetical protein
MRRDQGWHISRLGHTVMQCSPRAELADCIAVSTMAVYNCQLFPAFAERIRLCKVLRLRLADTEAMI